MNIILIGISGIISTTIWLPRLQLIFSRFAEKVVSDNSFVIIGEPAFENAHCQTTTLSLLTMPHSVLLLQTTKDPGSRTYSDYDSQDACLREICNIFESLLRKSMPGMSSITYDIRDLYDFIDRLEDLAIIISQDSRGSRLYLPRGKQYIKKPYISCCWKRDRKRKACITHRIEILEIAFDS